MEEMDSHTQQVFNPYIERIQKLSASISEKDTEISILRYTLIGLQTTLASLDKAIPVPVKRPVLKLKPIPIKEVKSAPIPKKTTGIKPPATAKPKAITHRSLKKKADPQDNLDIPPEISAVTNRLETEIGEESKDLMDMEILRHMTSSVTLPSKKPEVGLSLTKSKSVLSPTKLHSKTPSKDSSRSPVPGSPSGSSSPDRHFLFKSKSGRILKTPGSRSSMNLDDSFIKDLGSFIHEEPEVLVIKLSNFKTSHGLSKLANIQNPKYIRVIDELDINNLFNGDVCKILRCLKKSKFVHSFITYTNHAISNIGINQILHRLKNKIRSIVITEKEDFEGGLTTHLKINRSSVSRLDKLVLHKPIEVNLMFAFGLKTIVLNYEKDKDSLLKTIIQKFSFFRKLRTFRFNIKNEEIFKDLESLHKAIIYRTNPPALGITVIPDENNRAIIDQMHTLEWTSLQYFRATINAMMPQVYFLESSLLSKLRQLKIKLEVGAKLENIAALDSFTSLESLSISTKLNVKAYQVFFRFCSFPKQITELEIGLFNFPAKELLDSSKDFNPHLNKKYENHETYGPFVRKVERLIDVRRLTLTLQTAKQFETWNSYIITSLLIHKDKVRHLDVNVNHVSAAGEPFDLDELCNKITHFRPHLKSLRLFSYLVTFSQVKLVKNLQNLHSLCLDLYAKEFFCQFRIFNIFEILNIEFLTHFELPILLFMDIYLPLFEKISACRNLKSLKVNLDGEGLTESQFRDIIDHISPLNKLENLDLSLKPFIGDQKLFDEVARRFEGKLPYLTRLVFESSCHLILEGPKNIRVKCVETTEEGVL